VKTSFLLRWARSDDFLSRLFDTSRALPVTDPQTLRFLQSIFAGQQPRQEIDRHKPLSLQTNPFADFNPPSQHNLLINSGVTPAAQNTLHDDQESSFPWLICHLMSAH
jgi:hypothetical protein